MTIRVSNGSLAFAIAEKETEERIVYKPYTIKSGVSIAANLREAFKTEPLLRHDTHRARVLIDEPVLLIPIEEYNEQNMSTLYHHSFPGTEGRAVLGNVLPELCLLYTSDAADE